MTIPECLKVECSYFDKCNTSDTYQPKIVILANLLFNQSDNVKNTCKQLRSAATTERKRELKKSLPVITPSGLFANRKGDSLLKHTGLLAFDIDGKDNPSVPTESMPILRDELAKEDIVVYAALSASGAGVWGLIRIHDPNKHVEHFKALLADWKRDYGIELDASCKEVNRLRFLSYDPEAKVNPNAILYTGLPSPVAPAKPKRVAVKRKYPGIEGDVKPWDQFNESHTPLELLTSSYGWRVVREDAKRVYLLRPGNTTAQHSGNYHKGKRLFKAFTSSTVLPEGQALTAHAVYTYYEHGGCFTTSGKALRGLGYGSTQKKQQTKPNTSEKNRVSVASVAPNKLLKAVPESLPIDTLRTQHKYNALLTGWAAEKCNHKPSEDLLVKAYPKQAQTILEGIRDGSITRKGIYDCHPEMVTSKRTKAMTSKEWNQAFDKHAVQTFDERAAISGFDYENSPSVEGIKFTSLNATQKYHAFMTGWAAIKADHKGSEVLLEKMYPSHANVILEGIRDGLITRSVINEVRAECDAHKMRQINIDDYTKRIDKALAVASDKQADESKREQAELQAKAMKGHLKKRYDHNYVPQNKREPKRTTEEWTKVFDAIAEKTFKPKANQAGTKDNHKPFF